MALAVESSTSRRIHHDPANNARTGHPSLVDAVVPRFGQWPPEVASEFWTTCVVALVHAHTSLRHQSMPDVSQGKVACPLDLHEWLPLREHLLPTCGQAPDFVNR